MSKGYHWQNNTRLRAETEVIAKPRELLRDLNNIAWLTDVQLRALAEVIRPYVRVVRADYVLSDDAPDYHKEYTWEMLRRWLEQAVGKELVTHLSEEPVSLSSLYDRDTRTPTAGTYTSSASQPDRSTP